MVLRMADERDPLDVVDETTAAYQETEKAHEAARKAAIAAVLAALRAGKRPTDVVERSPFTDAYVRRLARANGIEPRRKGAGGQ